MKTKDYIEKYGLSKSAKFSHNEFVEDLTYEFIALLEVGKASENIKGFDNAVRAIRMKWDAINNKTVGQLPDKLWGFFFATVIAKTKNKLFPEIIAERQARHEANQKAWKERQAWEEQEFSSYFDWSFLSFMTRKQQPSNELLLLGFETNSPKPTKEEVGKAYKRLSMIHHPDRGGKQEMFIAINEAKNKVLTWLS